MLKHSKRRMTVTGLAAVAAGALVLTGCSGGSSNADIDLGSGPPVAGEIKEGALKGVTLGFTSWGGIYQDAQMASLQGFIDKSGVNLLSDGPTEYAKIKAQVKSGNVSWDVVDADIVWAAMHCGEDGLLMDIDKSIVDTSKIEDDSLLNDCYVPAMTYGYVIMYNTEKYPTAPTGWADFFDTAKFPGKRGVAGHEDVGPGVFEGALLADGVPQDKLYPLDMDRVYKKLETIKSDLVYWKTGAEAQQMVESGEADMVLLWSGRAYKAAENGAKYKPIWNQALVMADVLTVPKNAKNPKASMALINYYLGAEAQEIMSEESSYSPVNVDAKPDFSDLAKQYLTSDPSIASQMVPTDAKWWAQNYDTELDRWMKWMKS